MTVAYVTIHDSSIRNNELHVLTLNKLIVARFVVIESFLIRYSNGYTQ